jgi:T5SS/PEP-CTERM-associated repeat protein
MQRIRRSCLVLGLATGIILGPHSTEAQYSGSYQTNIISGVTNAWSGEYIVGFYSADALLIQSNGVLSLPSLDDPLFVGGGNCSVVVTDPGSAILNAAYLSLTGGTGGNSLVISNGATMLTGSSDGDGAIFGSDTTTPNSVVVTGPGSVWSNNVGLYVGYSGAGSSLVIRNGGAVASGLKFLGAFTYIGYDSTTSNASVLVTDPGSVWSNGYALYVGYEGAACSLVISNGGKVFSGGHFGGNLGGVLGDAVAANGNTVQVVGSGSVWVNNGLAPGLGAVDVGGSGSSNSLVIGNGGQVFDSYGSIGPGSNSVNNSVLVADSGSVWSNSSAVYVGYSGAVNTLVITNGGVVFNPSAVVGLNTGGSSNSVVVTGGGVWQTAGALTVGNQGSSNGLLVAGGSVFAQSLTIGAASPTCDNIVELDSGNLTVTNNGAGVLEVRDGQLILNGGVLRADTLVITNACAQFIHTGGSLIVSNVVLDPNTFRITSITPQGNDMLITWLMGPGATNALQVTNGGTGGNYSTNGFTDVFTVTNNTTVGTSTNYLDVGALTNGPTRYYRARLAP